MTTKGTGSVKKQKQPGYGGTATITITLKMTAATQGDFQQAAWTVRDQIDRSMPVDGFVTSHSRRRRLAVVHSVEVDSTP